MNISWSIDLGGIMTILVVVGGFVFSILRRNVEVNALKATVDSLQSSVAALQIAVARLEERIKALS